MEFIELKEKETFNWYQKRINRSINHQNKIYDAGINRLSFKKKEGKKIWLDNGNICTEFMSCSYLGLDQNEKMVSATIESTQKFGIQFSAARTRMSPNITYEYEYLLGKIFNAPTVTFATCGLTHLAVFPILGSRELPSYPIKKNGIVWIMDKTAHASIQILQALLLQFGEVIRIDFQNITELRDAFQTCHNKNKTPISISDGIGSMGGNAPVKELINLAELYDGYTYLDDAHGTSIFGKNGGGYVLSELNDEFHPRLLLCSSLSKAFGATGGSISVYAEADAEFIRRYSNPYIFGGPLSLPGVAAGIESAKIHLSDEIQKLQKLLYSNIKYFDDQICQFELLNRGALIPIRGILIGSETLAVEICKTMLEKGFATTCATYPTVEKGKAMLRVAISAIHDKDTINSLFKTLNSIK